MTNHNVNRDLGRSAAEIVYQVGGKQPPAKTPDYDEESGERGWVKRLPMREYCFHCKKVQPNYANVGPGRTEYRCVVCHAVCDSDITDD